MPEPETLLEMTSDIVTSLVSNNTVNPDELAKLIGSIHATLAGLGQAQDEAGQVDSPEPAVSVRKSLSSPDFIISMIDGKPYKMLTRHIGVHGYTAETYRAAFGLKPDYPMIAPNYAEKRRALALSAGLGRKKAGSAKASGQNDPAAEPKIPDEQKPEGKKPRRTRRTVSKSKEGEAIKR